MRPNADVLPCLETDLYVPADGKTSHKRKKNERQDLEKGQKGDCEKMRNEKLLVKQNMRQ